LASIADWSGINLVPLFKKVMKENEKARPDRHLDTPSESNREKHINFPEIEEESSEQISIGSNRASERQKEWRKEIQEGEQAKEQSAPDQTGSAMPMDNDDTLGVP
jgi:hypothetical protein